MDQTAAPKTAKKDEREKKRKMQGGHESLTRDRATSVLVVCEELGPRIKGRSLSTLCPSVSKKNLCSVHDNSTKLNAVMGNCHTVGPNEALVRSGKIISYTISLRHE